MKKAKKYYKGYTFFMAYEARHKKGYRMMYVKNGFKEKSAFFDWVQEKTKEIKYGLNEDILIVNIKIIK